MLGQDHLRTLKQTHQTATTVMPLVTAGLALMSAMIAAQERRSAQAATAFVERQQTEPLDLPRIPFRHGGIARLLVSRKGKYTSSAAQVSTRGERAKRKAPPSGRVTPVRSGFLAHRGSPPG